MLSGEARTSLDLEDTPCIVSDGVNHLMPLVRLVASFNKLVVRNNREVIII